MRSFLHNAVKCATTSDSSQPNRLPGLQAATKSPTSPKSLRRMKPGWRRADVGDIEDDHFERSRQKPRVRDRTRGIDKAFGSADRIMLWETQKPSEHWVFRRRPMLPEAATSSALYRASPRTYESLIRKLVKWLKHSPEAFDEFPRHRAARTHPTR